VWFEAWRTLRLAWRLLRDHRVSPFIKLLIPGLALVYVLFPIDVAPDLLPLLGQLDDLAILILAARLLIELSPPAVVAEHEFDLHESASRQPTESSPDEVVEADYRIIDE
jgi:uncharacterized membrane protein YkvA (DUF1232 family)